MAQHTLARHCDRIPNTSWGIWARTRVSTEGFGDCCRQDLREVDDLEGFRWAGEARDPEASAERRGRVRHGCNTHIGFGFYCDGEIGQDFGVEDHAWSKIRAGHLDDRVGCTGLEARQRGDAGEFRIGLSQP